MNKQIEKYLHKFSKIGIAKNLSEEEEFKSQSVNFICFIIIAIALIAVIINIINNNLIRVFSASLFVLSFIIPIILNYFGKRLAAKGSLLFGGFVAIIVHSLLYGGGMDIEFILLLTPVAALLLTNDQIFFRLSLFFSFLLFSIIKSLPYIYKPLCPSEEVLYIQLLVGVGMLSLVVLILKRFKKETLMAQKNAERALEELKKTHKALALSEARYKAVFDNAFDGILLVDLETRKAISCNQKILDFLGVPEALVKKVDVTEYLTREGIFDLNKNIELAKLKGSAKDKARIKSKNGKEIFAEVSGVVLPDTDNKYAVAMFKDITSEMLAQERLLIANQELRNFAHAASHDMKEPLRMIQSFGQLLKKRNVSNFSPESEEFLGYIINASRRMTQLVQDLLEYSTTGTQNIQDCSIDLNNVLTVVKNNLRLKILETKTEIISGHLPTVFGNNTQMIQIFQNITSNAIKFQKANEIPRIKISSSIFEGRNIISIQDNGIGIAEEYHDQVFGIFKRLHSKKDYEGSGIGLATCKKIIEKMGGRIWLESGSGKGTTFFFNLPLIKNPNDSNQTESFLEEASLESIMN